jgi:hypothetical protein
MYNSGLVFLLLGSWLEVSGMKCKQDPQYQCKRLNHILVIELFYERLVLIVMKEIGGK